MNVVVPPNRATLFLKSCLSVLYEGAILPVRDFVYPPVCLTCDAMLAGGEEQVCARCWNSIPRIEPDHPVWTELAGTMRAEGVVRDLLSCYLFEKEGKLQEILHLLKYRGMRSLAEPLGREAGKRMLRNPEFLSADSLVPVPLNKSRQRERGYNQAEAICRGISAETRIPVSKSLLLRRRHTESQTELDRAQRRENVRGAFAVNPKHRRDVEGRCFVLVDDVMTTGSTATACAQELLENGADHVLAVAVALAA